MNDFIDIGDYITCSEFYDSYWSIWFIDDLEDEYIDDFEDMGWLYTFPDYSIHDNRSLLILNILIYLRNLTDYTWYLPDNYHVHVIINCWENIVTR